MSPHPASLICPTCEEEEIQADGTCPVCDGEEEDPGILGLVDAVADMREKNAAANPDDLAYKDSIDVLAPGPAELNEDPFIDQRTQQFRIEEGHSPPGKAGDLVRHYPLDDMRPGQSFFVPEGWKGKTVKQLHASIKSAATRSGNAGKITLRTVTEKGVTGVRCYRKDARGGRRRG